MRFQEPHDTLPVYIGASCKGILIYTGQSRTHNIDWSELVKVDYSGKEIRLTLSENYRGQITAAGTPTGTLNGHGPGSPSIMDKSLTVSDIIKTQKNYWNTCCDVIHVAKIHE